MLNAIMHRLLESNAPIRFYEYDAHLEITNPGGLYGQSRPENFPCVNDYRNPIIAEAMKVLGYVNMFNHGIGAVQDELKANGNIKADFISDQVTHFQVLIPAAQTKTNATTQTAQTDGKTTQTDENTTQTDENTTQTTQTTQTIKFTQLQLDIMKLLRANPNFGRRELAEKLPYTTEDGIKYNIGILRSKGYIRREGNPTYGGRWEVLFPEDGQ